MIPENMRRAMAGMMSDDLLIAPGIPATDLPATVVEFFLRTLRWKKVTAPHTNAVQRQPRDTPIQGDDQLRVPSAHAAAHHNAVDSTI